MAILINNALNFILPKSHELQYHDLAFEIYTSKVLPIMAYTERLLQKMGTDFRLQAHERIDNSQVELYERVRKSDI